MKVYLHSGFEKQIAKSGVGRAIKHQMMALESVGIEYTLDSESEYTLAHINTIFPESFMLAMRCKEAKIPVVYHAHSTEEDFKDSFVGSNTVAPLFKQWLIACYNSGQIVITPTEYSKKLILNYGLKVPVEVVSNGIDLNFWHATDDEVKNFRSTLGLKPDDKMILAVGLPIKRKGILDYIELAKRMPDYKFYWFGQIDEFLLPIDIRNKIKERPNNLYMPGYIDREKIRIAYKAANVYLFPTHEETEGIVLLEALASRTPTVIRDIPIYKDWFQNGENIYKANTVDDFENIIKKIINKELPDLTEAGYNKAAEKRIENIGQRLISVYEKAIALKEEEIGLNLF
ncbi:MAG: glycosyltransferase [Tissierellia bacterium]|nr:glycosyltransferase [Tissierellia bacterium]